MRFSLVVDQASKNKLYETLQQLQYILGRNRSVWPAWAQYIYLRHRRLRDGR